MSYITWTTKAGSLGTVAENEFFEKAILAKDSGGAEIYYRFLSGTLPPGVQVVSIGVIQGVPEATTTTAADTTYTYSFVIRASTAAGAVADRTFSMTISSIVAPVLLTEAGKLTEIFDGTYFSYQFSARDTANSKLTYSIASGNLPPGLTFNSSGLLTGYPDLVYRTDEAGLFGYDANRHDVYGYDYAGRSLTKNYNFSVRVTDGLNFDVKEYIITVYSKGSWTSDSNLVLNSTFITADADNEYLPILVTPGGSIGTVRQKDKFNFKFDTYDANFDLVGLSVSTLQESGFDQNGDNETHTAGIGFDTTEFDQGDQRLPTGLSLNATSHWLSGVAPTQTEARKTYSFKVIPYKYGYIGKTGKSVIYTLTVLGSEFNSITWISPEYLGVIDEGKPCTVQIEATSSTGKEVVFSIESGSYLSFPQGVQLTKDGYLIGRPTFRRFSVDSNYTIVTVADNTNVEVGMSVTGPSVGTGVTVTELPDSNTIVVAPAIVAAAGTVLTFFNNTSSYELTTTEPNRTTTITDNGQTTFDKIRNFTVRATTIDDSYSDTRNFSIKINEYNQAPYENVYLKALPSVAQRQFLHSILNNTNFFPNDILYRLNDPWFSRTKDIRALLLPGIAPNSLSKYAEAIARNHYNKTIKFGQIKTARAVDEFFNTKYEVVYIELADNQTNKGVTISQEQIDLSTVITNYFNDDTAYRYLYPNSFNNMTNRLGGVLGFENRGALPDWMTSPQTDGRVIGFVPAAVLAYTKPGHAESIKFRLEQAKVDFNTISFIADRYQIDNVLSANYDIENNKFRAGSETTFDYVPRAGAIVATVNYAVNKTFESINGRTVNYINDVLGGLDGFKDFQDGDTLVFAQQENYLGNTKPNDGWLRYSDSYNDYGFDTRGLDQVDIIPGYLAKSTGFSTENQRGGVWTVRITNNKVTLEFTQEILVSQRVRVGNGVSYGSTIIVYDPLVAFGFSVPAYTLVTNINITSDQRTTFDGNGTRFITYRDNYTNPEIGDKYIKFPQIGVFN